MWSVKNWAGEALKMPTVNYLQRETQTRPVFKTYRMVSLQPINARDGGLTRDLRTALFRTRKMG